MEYVANGLMLTSLVVSVIFLVVIATLYIRPEQTGLTLRTHSERVDLYTMLGLLAFIVVASLFMIGAQVDLTTAVMTFIFITALQGMLVYILAFRIKQGRERVGR